LFSLSYFIINFVTGAVVKSKLALERFYIVVEDDGSTVDNDVLMAVIEDGENIGTLMILDQSQNWTSGL